ncbi:hypothetical protein [Bacillus sp. MRMR6]|uniref:hypothetical protein n=1 Tax=Bacillus sp. MRMR6 TaxID=1928617 RepID=UPI000950EE40|nr:hypothetical protein [Bacillus sp. MRMR6]OLS40508.1 hypothetical protein BTR25_08350 [Bacillus sp. MRMR6]
MYPYGFQQVSSSQYDYTPYDQYLVQNHFDPDRQPPQLERRVSQLERQNQQQERQIDQLQRDVNQLQRRIQRINQRLRQVERRFNFPFTPYDGEY